MALSSAFRTLLSQSKSKYSSNNSKTIKPKDGRNIYRIVAPNEAIAPWAKGGKFWADLALHWIKADKDGKPLAVVGCREVVYDEYSPVSAMIQAAIASAYDEDMKALYESWKARKSILVNVIDRSTNSDAVEILELTPTTFASIIEQIELYADSGVDILDPIEGLDIYITKTGKMLNTKYDISVAPQIPGKAKVPITDAQLRSCNDLQKFIAENHFRGEEQKAMNLISQFSGVAQPNVASLGARTPTAAIASQGAVVEGAVATVTAAVAAAAVARPAIASVATVATVAQPAVAQVINVAEPLALSPEVERDVFAELDDLMNQ